MKKRSFQGQRTKLICIFITFQNSITLIFGICWHKLPYLPYLQPPPPENLCQHLSDFRTPTPSASDITFERSLIAKTNTQNAHVSALNIKPTRHIWVITSQWNPYRCWQVFLFWYCANNTTIDYNFLPGHCAISKNKIEKKCWIPKSKVLN